MVHDQITGYLPDLAAGALDGELATRLRAHLQECRECREWLATHRTLEAALELPPPEADHPTSELLASFVVDSSCLEAGVRESVSGHLEICRRCAREAELCRQAVAVLPAVRRRERPVEPMGPRPSRSSIPAAGGARGAGLSRFRIRVAIAAATLIALVGGGLFLMRGPRTQQRHILSHRTLTGAATIEAVDTIEATQAHLEAGSDVLLRAENIALGNGFTVGNNAKLTIETRSRIDN